MPPSPGPASWAARRLSSRWIFRMWAGSPTSRIRSVPSSGSSSPPTRCSTRSLGRGRSGHGPVTVPKGQSLRCRFQRRRRGRSRRVHLDGLVPRKGLQRENSSDRTPMSARAAAGGQSLGPVRTNQDARRPPGRVPALGQELARCARSDHVLARLDDHDPNAAAEIPEALGHVMSNTLRVLADAAGEDERVEPSERGRHPADGAGDAVGEDRECKPGGRLVGGLELLDVPREPESPSSPDSRSSASSSSSSPSFPPRSRCSTISGSIEPDRVAIGTPSSGLKPMVVSTERPSRTAVTEQPPPRWQTTSRGTGTCSAAHATDSPWKP